MNSLDLFLLIPLIYGAYTGFQRGVLVEIIAVVAFVVSLILGFKLLNEAIGFLAPYVGENISRRFLPYIGFSGVFITVIFMINRFGWLLRKSIRYTMLGGFDSMAGAAVGLFTYAFGMSIFFWLLATFKVSFPAEPLRKGSLVYPVLRPLAPKVMEKVSSAIPQRDILLEKVDQLQHP